MILRPHQNLALGGLRQSVGSGHRRPMLSLCTGSGKTIIAAKAVIGALAKGNPTAFCVPSIGLVDQTAARFISNGIPADDIGIVQGDHAWRRDHARVQICTAQTLARRDLPKSAVVFVDEAHIRFSIYERWMTANPDTVFIGMSATPWAKGLGRWYDDLIKPIGMQELIDKGYLSKFIAFAPPTVDLTGVHTVAGDFVEDELANLMNKPRLVADIVSTWLERGHGRPTLCFAVNRAHAKSIRDKFEQEGVRCAYVDAFTPREERDDIGVAMAEGVVQVTVNIGCLTTGTDWPHVSCIILARPTKSESLFVQIMGRGLRPIYPDGFDEAAATDEERAAALATMKDHCIAEGSMVLTDKGLIEIEKVTLAHKVWDGENWVSHGGAVCKGVQPVIRYAGITATPDHEVWTKNGWKQLRTAADGRLGIAQTERDGEAIRLSENCFSRGSLEHHAERVEGSVRKNPMRDLWANGMDQLLEYRSRAIRWVSSMQPAITRPGMASKAYELCKTEMLQSEQREIRRLGWKGNRIPFFITFSCGDMDSGKPWFGKKQTSRQDKQRWSLRADEFEVIDEQREYVEPAQAEKARVWDILNAGPHHRFTVSGSLVHNCLFLDHSDTHTRIGMITDIDHSHLSLARASRNAADGKERDEVVLPRACQCCGSLVPPRSSECPSCGHTNVAPNQVDQIDGELVELRGAGQRPAKKGQTITEQLKSLGPQELKAQINSLRREMNWSNGRASHFYKDIMGVWPKGDWDFSIPYAEPCGILRSFDRHRRIAYAKGMAAQKRA